MNSKLKWLECIRGGAILLVVLGHLTLINGVGTYSEIIYLFHMPLFFAISGFLFGYREMQKKETPNQLIKRKLITLGIPYLFFSVIYICFNVFFQRFVSTNTTVDIKSILTLLWKPVAQYWFLWLLLIYFVVVAYCGNKPWKLMLLLIAGILISLQEELFTDGLDTAYHSRLIYFFYFVAAATMGYIFERKKIKSINAHWYFILLAVITGALFFDIATHKEILAGLQARETILRILGIISFSLSVITVCEIRVFRNVFIKIGEYSWYIYLLHSYFLCFVRMAIKKVLPMGNMAVEVMIGMMFSVGGCMLIGYISKKHWWIDCVFYPQHFLKKERLIV